MEPFRTNGFATNYNLEKLKDNLQDDSLNEDEETIFMKPNNGGEERISNPITGIPDEVFLLNRELSIEEFETGGSGNWEEDVLKIVELAETPVIPLVEEVSCDTGYNRSRSKSQSSQESSTCITGLGVHDIQKVSHALRLFGLKEGMDYTFEGDEDGYVTLKKISRTAKDSEGKREIDHQIGEGRVKGEGNTTFNQIMGSLKSGIRIKKKIGKGFVKINSDNFPMTHHEVYAWSVNQRVEFQSAEESIQCLFKKAKQLKGLSKGLDLSNIVIL
ncbi:phosphoprotein [Puchong virus]|uniref:Phosphoprotein n=1 Tax=Puchong virus TaxID=1272955 RepID=A0A7D0ITV4_9RHAB|nr:phosphoprotein [Puchong virus]QEA08641.1 phosphoprotein [Puchong virus]